VLFVDFQKAFDGIPHPHLTYSLITNGVHGHILQILRSLYDNLESCVRLSGGLTDFFECTIGTRQGCILSPALFSLYMKKLVDMLKEFDCKGIYVNEEARNLMALLYADDVTEGACTVRKLQDMIHVLEEFCKMWGLAVNIEKTKVMVFRKGGKVKKNEKWFMNGVQIETVALYKYLGLFFTCGLSWTKAVHNLSLKAKKAVNMILMYSRKCGGLPVSVGLELFNKMIVPILTYGAEVWGTKKFKDIESIQIYFCKKMIGLPQQTTNNAVMGECGQYPVYIECVKKCIKYWLKILRMPDTRYVKCCYGMLKGMDENGKETWVSGIRTLLFQYGYGVVWMNQGVGDEGIFILQLMQRLKDTYRQDWYREVHDSSKLSIYCTFKATLALEPYLKIVNKWSLRKAMAKLRVSAHKLEVETGRHNGILLENRLCTYCDSRGLAVIEDEYHFVLCCPKYATLRVKYINTLDTQFKTFIGLMSSNDANEIKNLALYIYHAFKLRD